ncbi:MAG: NifB/NifX family molybdenum-iron cluster-binding protein [Desulfurococcus sp.]|nr:NifB/NifX family molybdenum-iron cluster-binding protein [Desulfurococcus sp.]
MKRIGIPTSRGGLDDLVAERFGRAPTITIVSVDPSTRRILSVEVVANPGAEAGSGAGVKAAQALADHGVEVYAGPSPGPNAYAALTALGIKIITVTGVTVREAVERVLEELAENP